MKITTASYSCLVNLGSYNNERIGFAAKIEDGETPDEVLEALRSKALSLANENGEEMWGKLSKARRDLNDLNQKIKEATDKWNATAEFLRAQGLKPDSPKMPEFINLLPEVKEESKEVYEGEFEEDEDDGEDDDIPV